MHDRLTLDSYGTLSGRGGPSLRSGTPDEKKERSNMLPFDVLIWVALIIIAVIVFVARGGRLVEGKTLSAEAASGGKCPFCLESVSPAAKK